MELTPLGAAQTRSLFDRYDPQGRTPPELPGGVHRLTGGRPVGVALLARAAGGAPAGTRDALTPGALLDLTVEVREDSPPYRSPGRCWRSCCRGCAPRTWPR